MSASLDTAPLTAVSPSLLANVAAAVRAELWTRQFTYTEARLMRLAILPVTLDCGRHTFLFPNREVLYRKGKMTKGNCSDCLTHLEKCSVLRIEDRGRDGVLAPDPYFSLRLTVLPPPYPLVPLLPEFEPLTDEEKQLSEFLLELDPDRPPDERQYELFRRKYGLLEALLDSFRGNFNFSTSSSAVLAAAEHVEHGGAVCARTSTPTSVQGPMRPVVETSNSQSAAALPGETQAEFAAGLAASSIGLTPHHPGESVEEHCARIAAKLRVPNFGTMVNAPAHHEVPNVGTERKSDEVPKFGTTPKIPAGARVPKFGTSSMGGKGGHDRSCIKHGSEKDHDHDPTWPERARAMMAAEGLSEKTAGEIFADLLTVAQGQLQCPGCRRDWKRRIFENSRAVCEGIALARSPGTVNPVGLMNDHYLVRIGKKRYTGTGCEWLPRQRV